MADSKYATLGELCGAMIFTIVLALVVFLASLLAMDHRASKIERRVTALEGGKR